MDLLDAVRRQLDREGMLLGAETVLCGLSGGADSVCLLHALRTLAPEYGVRVAAAHYNHRLRGGESDRDAAFAASLCRDWGVPLYPGGGDVMTYARQQHLGTEEAARTLRYAFFEQCADTLPGCRIATAHQADDNAETLLLNLLRGAGLRGLGGIPPVRGRVIRPLLSVTRAEIDDYLQAQSLPHVEDSSNGTDDYLRNRLRHTVLPALRALDPQVCGTVARTLTLLRADEAYLSGAAEAYVNREEDEVLLSAAQLAALPVPLSSRALRLAAEAFGVRLSQKHTEAALGLAASPNGYGSVSLPGGLQAARTGDRLRVGFPLPSPDAAPFPARELPFGSWTALEEAGLRLFYGPISESTKIHGKFTTFFFKKEKICGSITVRPRRPGDYLHPVGRGCGKSLKKLLAEAKIPAEARARVPIFADGAGVLAVGCLAADRRAAVPAAEADAVLCISRMEGKDCAD